VQKNKHEEEREIFDFFWEINPKKRFFNFNFADHGLYRPYE
jgi:hypothetical protein